MAKNHRGVELVGFVHTPNGGNPPKWSDGTIGWEGKEELHRQYLEQNNFKNLDEYDDQVKHAKNKVGDIKRSDIDDLRDEIDTFDKLSNGSFMKDRHLSNLISKVSKKKSLINSQIAYMKNHKMENTDLYKQLESLSKRLDTIQDRLKNIDI